MKTFAVATILALPLLSGQSQKFQNAPPANTGGIAGRYQMISAPLEDGVTAPAKTVIILDTVTGKAWKYQEAFSGKDESGKPIFTPPRFVSLPVEGLN